MALTFAFKRSLDIGSLKGAIVNVTFDSSYPTGGEDCTAANFGFTQVDAIIPMAGNPGYGFQFTGSKLLAFNGTTQIANATNLSTLAPDFLVLGS